MEGMFKIFQKDGAVDTEVLLKTATHFDFTVEPIIKWEEEFETNVHGSSFEFLPFGYTCAMDSLQLQPWFFPGEMDVYTSTKSDSIQFKDVNQLLKVKGGQLILTTLRILFFIPGTPDCLEVPLCSIKDISKTGGFGIM